MKPWIVAIVNIHRGANAVTSRSKTAQTSGDQGSTFASVKHLILTIRRSFSA
jgi:hypothetical protein